VKRQKNPIYYFENRISEGNQAECDPIFDDDILGEGECRTPGCLEDYYSDIVDQDVLLNAGDAASFYTHIASSPNSSPLLAALSAASPYLSDGVMLAILGSGMTSTNMRNILGQNIPLSPHILAIASASLDSGDYSYLENLHTPGMASVRDSVSALRLSLSNIKNALLWHLVDSLVREEEYEDADDLLAADPDRFARETRIGLKNADRRLHPCGPTSLGISDNIDGRCRLQVYTATQPWLSVCRHSPFVF
jgi:hypothetical protein